MQVHALRQYCFAIDAALDQHTTTISYVLMCEYLGEFSPRNIISQREHRAPLRHSHTLAGCAAVWGSLAQSVCRSRVWPVWLGLPSPFSMDSQSFLALSRTHICFRLGIGCCLPAGRHNWITNNRPQWLENGILS